MKGKILINTIMIIIFISFVGGAMNPARGYCEHMGYEVNENYFCVFDKDNKCGIGEFYEGTCGQEYIKEIPCRKLGEIVFSEFEKCCEGKPYLPPFVAGQSSCQPLSKRIEGNLKNGIYYPINYWPITIILLILIGYLFYRRLKRK